MKVTIVRAIMHIFSEKFCNFALHLGESESHF